MQYRPLGRTGWNISTVSFGAWAIGGTWGPVDDTEAMSALHYALDVGVNFFDTADVYGDGHSERLLARLRRERKDTFYIATKAGRRAARHVAKAYTRKNLTAYVERSLANLETEALDLLQLHCPPTSVYYMPEVFGVLDGLVAAGKVRHYGVSVEKVEEGMKALDYPGVQSVQIIFNPFRQRPAERFFSMAHAAGVGILARLPLCSGLLTGKFSADSTFAEDDHRKFNREGAAFDKGETFSGIDYATGLAAVRELRRHVPEGFTMGQMALRWIQMNPHVTCSIPGARRPLQVAENMAAADLPALDPATMRAIAEIYGQYAKPLVHGRW
ncbi:aldo/keto reductase [Betaproteobacteria bacterium GR16-43]|nr:aldo/keto reductase [Betaproteobacteria bacterium GR16-43]